MMLNTTETAAVKGRNSTAPHLLQSPHSSTSILKTHDEKLKLKNIKTYSIKDNKYE